MEVAERELLCQRCEREYPVWFAPNELWNAVVQDGEHFLCLTCFAILGEERGARPTAWCLRLETEDDGELAFLKCQIRDRQALPLTAPGSPLAKRHNCLCPQMDNAHGKGYLGDACQFGWVIREDCPVHGLIIK